MGLVIAEGRRPRSTSAPLREAITALSRALEDASWTNLSTEARDPTDRTYDERRREILRSREMLKRSPLAKTAGTLLVNYVLGQGVSITAANKTRVAPIVDEFWQHPDNQMTLTSHQAMTELLLGAFTDGAQYLVLFPDTDEGTVEVGYLDALYVEDIIMDRENARVPRWVKAKRPKGGFDFRAGHYTATEGDEFVYFRHWMNDLPLGGKDAPSKVEPGLIYQMKRGKGRFGQPELAAALDWLKAHKEFMEDRATITRAAASLAWRKKRKAGPIGIQQQVEQIQSRLAQTVYGGQPAGYENNPPPATASTIVENEGSTTEWIKTDTGGQAALADERILRMMAGAGMGGVPNHYFGDEANANLATATSMELPLLKNYESWQKWLGDAIGDVLRFLLQVAHEAGKVGPEDTSLKYADRGMTKEQVVDQSAPPPPIPLAPGKPPANAGSPYPQLPPGPGTPGASARLPE